MNTNKNKAIKVDLYSNGISLKVLYTTNQKKRSDQNLPFTLQKLIKTRYGCVPELFYNSRNNIISVVIGRIPPRSISNRFSKQLKLAANLLPWDFAAIHIYFDSNALSKRKFLIPKSSVLIGEVKFRAFDKSVNNG